MRTVTVVTWAAATLWIPPLIYFGLHRISQGPDMLHFAGVWWAFVFPLGMYSAATYAMATELSQRSLITVSLVFFWDALATWLIVVGRRAVARVACARTQSRHIACRPTVGVVTNRQERAMSFGSVAEDYDELRPQAPQQAVDWLVPTGCEVAVDVGAGTGLFTRTLVGRAAQVIAVEPDARMRKVLTARSPGVRVVEGRGESIPLVDAAADAVFVSSAWHWMDPERAVPEIGRVLRDGGRFGLIWTSRDREVDWVRNLDRLPGGDRVDAQLADRFRQRLYFDLPEPRIFHNIAREKFRFVRTMTVGDAVAMLGTYSRAIVASADDRARALAEARTALDERFPGADAIDIPMRAWCWRADRIARGGVD